MTTENKRIWFWSLTTGLIVYLLMRNKAAPSGAANVQFRTNLGQYLTVEQQTEEGPVEILPSTPINFDSPVDVSFGGGDYVADLHYFEG